MRAWLRAYWGGGEGIHGAKYGYHQSMVLLGDADHVPQPILWLEDQKAYFGSIEDYDRGRWKQTCDECGEPIPDGAVGHPPTALPGGGFQVHVKWRYDTASGLLEPGCLYWTPWKHHRSDPAAQRACWEWDNCEDPRGHLMAVLPNGHEWDIDSRASNCTMPNDKLHRCWVRHGEPPDVHVDKNGVTCAAGAGSIAVPGYHGFLHNGEFTAG